MKTKLTTAGKNDVEQKAKNEMEKIFNLIKISTIVNDKIREMMAHAHITTPHSPKQSPGERHPAVSVKATYAAISSMLYEQKNS